MTALTMTSAFSAKTVRMPLWNGARPFHSAAQTVVEPRSRTTVSDSVLQRLAGPEMERVIEISPAVTDSGVSLLSRIGQFFDLASDAGQLWPLRERVGKLYWTTLGAATADDESGILFEAQQCLSQLNALERSVPHRKAGKWLMGIIESALAADDLKFVDMILRRADPVLMSSWSVNAMFRSTYRARHFLPAWGPALTRAQAKLSTREDAKGLFVGLE